MSRSPRRARAVIDATLVEQLETLAGAATARFPDVAYPLVNKLASARLVQPARMPDDVATIGSAVEYRDEARDQVRRVRLVWPDEADISRGRISVLTPIGVALLGLGPGERFGWTTRGGEEKALTVLAVSQGEMKIDGA